MSEDHSIDDNGDLVIDPDNLLTYDPPRHSIDYDKIHDFLQRTELATIYEVVGFWEFTIQSGEWITVKVLRDTRDSRTPSYYAVHNAIVHRPEVSRFKDRPDCDPFNDPQEDVLRPSDTVHQALSNCIGSFFAKYNYSDGKITIKTDFFKMPNTDYHPEYDPYDEQGSLKIKDK